MIPAKAGLLKWKTVQEQISQQNHRANDIGKFRVELEDTWGVIKMRVERMWGGIDIRSENTQACSKLMRDINPQIQLIQHSLSRVTTQEILMK